MNNDQPETKQERRERKLRKKRERILQHGKGLAQIYKEAIIKRISYLRKENQKGPGK